MTHSEVHSRAQRRRTNTDLEKELKVTAGGEGGMRWEFGVDRHTLLYLRQITRETSLAAQWLGLCASTAEGTGSIPGQGTKILHATRCGQEIKKIKIKALSIKKKKDRQPVGTYCVAQGTPLHTL